jgi:Cu(I)-responsive transcriptional regulator
MRIGEMASTTATNIETVRYYEKIGLLPAPARDTANYRSYGKEHLARLSFIRRARDLGFTLDQVRELLGLADDRLQSCAAVDAIATTHLTEIDRKIADLQSLRSELSRLIGDCRQGTIDECLIIDSLAPAGLAQ